MSATSPKRVVIVGGTSTIARHAARIWLAQGTIRLHLIGRDESRLSAAAADLRVRAPQAEITTAVLDLGDPTAIRAEIDRSVQAVDPEVVLIAHGNMHEQSRMQQDLALAADQLLGAGVSPVLWLEGFADALAGGSVAVNGPPAGDRGRAQNYLYGAAKGMIERAVQGLRHRVARSGGPTIVLVKPGPTRTRMTASLAGARMAEPAQVAAGLVRAVARGRAVTYVPGIWRVIMLVVRSLPSAVLHRTDF